MSSSGMNGQGPNDQKILNEELVCGMAEVARRNPQHAVDVFGIGFGVALRLAALDESQLDDLATTAAALWRPALSEAGIRGLSERRPMKRPELEIYRPVVERINRLALATFVRYSDAIASAALVCHIVDHAVISALQALPAFAVMEWGGHPGAPIVAPLLCEAAIDRLLRGDGEPVDSGLRSLLAFNQSTGPDFDHLYRDLRRDASSAALLCAEPSVKRSGRPIAQFLMPRTSALILTMLRHQMRPSEVEEHLLATSDVRAAQLREIAAKINPRPKRAKGTPRDRSRDHRDLWGSAQRRLTATAIYRLHCRLIDAGGEPFEAMVQAYDYYVCNYQPRCSVSLSRMLKDVFVPMRHSFDTRLCHCIKCDVVHLSHDEKTGVIECPVCVLARAGKYGSRRVRQARLDLCEDDLRDSVSGALHAQTQQAATGEWAGWGG